MEDQEILSEIKRTLDIEADSIRKLEETIDEKSLLNVVKAFTNCKGRIVFSGCGTSAMAAKKVVHSLCCIECPAIFLTPSDAVHGALGTLQKGDILVLISKGGNTAELCRMIPACKTKEVILICVSENSDSAIGSEADIMLRIKVDHEPCPFNMLATASTLAVIAVFDAICIALMGYTHYTREQFAVIHPGGAVGERLLSK